jgi:hypothetical protein
LTAQNKTIPIDYRGAYTNDRIKGQLSNGTAVVANLSGFNGNRYVAYQVAVRDLMTED